MGNKPTDKGEWVSVEDRLPEYGERVFVYNNKWGYNYKIHIESRNRIIGWGLWPKPTHWLPLSTLPSPPNK